MARHMMVAVLLTFVFWQHPAHAACTATTNAMQCEAVNFTPGSADYGVTHVFQKHCAGQAQNQHNENSTFNATYCGATPSRDTLWGNLRDLCGAVKAAADCSVTATSTERTYTGTTPSVVGNRGAGTADTRKVKFVFSKNASNVWVLTTAYPIP